MTVKEPPAVHIEQKTGELSGEDPEVMGPKAFGLIDLADPALIRSMSAGLATRASKELLDDYRAITP